MFRLLTQSSCCVYRKPLLRCVTAPICTADASCWSGPRLRRRWRPWDGKRQNTSMVICSLFAESVETITTQFAHLFLVYVPYQWPPRSSERQKCWREFWKRWKLTGLQRTELFKQYGSSRGFNTILSEWNCEQKEAPIVLWIRRKLCRTDQLRKTFLILIFYVLYRNVFQRKMNWCQFYIKVFFML